MSRPLAITIGNFDGVHLGHASLVRAGRAAVGQDGEVVALVFDPHPATVLRPGHAPDRLSTFAQREARLLEAGADRVERLEPTRDLLSQTADAFVRGLVDRFTPAFIVEGPDFRFGRGRAGSVATLRELERAGGYETIVIDPVRATLVDHAEATVSSSTVRWLLRAGRVRDATALLDRPYEIVTAVVPGDRRGREIGVPTANLDDAGWCLPADGIYAAEASREDGTRFPAAVSVGTKPTFGACPRVCEAHLIEYDGPLNDYGWTIRLRFVAWLRDQLAYAGVEPLVAQIRRDMDETCARVRPATC